MKFKHSEYMASAIFTVSFFLKSESALHKYYLLYPAPIKGMDKVHVLYKYQREKLS